MPMKRKSERNDNVKSEYYKLNIKNDRLKIGGRDKDEREKKNPTIIDGNPLKRHLDAPATHCSYELKKKN